MSEIHLPLTGTRTLRLGAAFIARNKRRGWPPVVGLGLMALFSLALWTLIVACVWALI